VTDKADIRPAATNEAPLDEQRRGVIQGFCAYLLWGLFPLYFHALQPSGAWEILAHRILWTFAFCLLLLMIRRDWSWIRPLLHRPLLLGGIAVAAVLIAVNWVLYVAAVVSGNVSEAALGYFLNPIVTVALGVVVLRERLRPLQWVAVAIGLVAALYLSLGAGRVPWIALILACSFAASKYAAAASGSPARSKCSLRKTGSCSPRRSAARRCNARLRELSRDA